MSPDDRVDPTPLLELIETMHREAAEAGYRGTDPRAGWWYRLTGESIHGTKWEGRILRAKKRGWILREHQDQIMALAAQRASLEPRPRSERDLVPRLPSAPLGRDYFGDEEMIPVYLADEICIKRLGVHPCMIYGDDWWDVA
jgi:hypothetical protein